MIDGNPNLNYSTNEKQNYILIPSFVPHSGL
jgi:hypothetical protein